MRICVVPIDNRPVCYNLIKDICDIDNNIELFIPPRDYLGDIKKIANTEKIIAWLNDLPQMDSVIISLDTIAYGGLIPSRRTNDTFENIKSRVEEIKPFIKKNNVYAFSSIMRISNNNYNEEEKEYWKDFGKQIFEYSYKVSKGENFKTSVPKEILQDYLDTRKRNFEINKIYLEWQKEGLFKKLIFSKDDCAEYGFNVDESKELEKLGGFTKTGADEIPLTLLAGAIKKDIKIFVKYTEPEHKDKISNYEDISIEKSVCGQLELGGFTIVESEDEADIVLVVNNFIEKQGELVMNWDTEPYKGDFKFPKKQYAVADVRFANGADNNFISDIFNKKIYPEFGYSAWNTSANTIGSLLAAIKVKFNAQNYNENSWKKLQAVRLLDDWAYQANIRSKTEYPQDISYKMKNYEKIIENILELKIDAKYSYPWHRKFEIEITIN